MTYLQRLLISDGAFVAPANVLEDTVAEQAKVRPAGVPHSLYEELWHVDFWQHLILSVIHGEPVSYPKRAPEGWPDDNDTLTERAWRDFRSRFLLDLKEVAVLAGSQRLEEVVGIKPYGSTSRALPDITAIT